MSDKKHLAPQLAASAARGVILAMNTKINPEGKSQQTRKREVLMNSRERLVAVVPAVVKIWK